MKKIFLLLLSFSLFVTQTFSQCAETPQPKVFLVGDSWAWFMSTQSIINSVLKTWGHSNYTFVSSAVVAENGAETDDFLKADKKAEIQNLLNQNPSIEVVHLSIGGNDFLGDWNVNMTQGQTDTLTGNVFLRLDSVIQFIKSCKPGIKVFWSGYVYPNFAEPINDMAPFQTSQPFYGTWHGMGDPSFLQINTLLNSISLQFDSIYANDPQVGFEICTGLMQYVFGQTTQMSVPPSGTYAPFTQPLPFGDPNYPSPKTAMNDYGFTKDCFHLSANGYKAFFGYHTQKFYHKYLMDDLYVLSENNAQTGTVSSQGNVANALSLGSASGEDFATVLSFNTTAMADTTLAKASIFLRRESLTGTNPLSGTLQVTVKNGNIGTTADVEAADYNATGDASDAPCKFGSIAANGDWVRLDLPIAMLQYITNNASTQFMIKAPGASGMVTFSNASDPDFAPVLNLAYGQAPSAIAKTENPAFFSVYPNPTSGLLTIETNGEAIRHMVISNSLGQVVLQSSAQQNTVDISALAAGIYNLRVTTLKGTSSQRIYKN